ncbi:FAD-dependent oxidoreductase [Bifidobacterium myosotis]|nr:FAD-dependent oxidoreductase [Bifidobacterium myosotis]
MKRITSNIALAWAVVLFIIPLPFLATLVAGFPALYSDALFGAELGVVAYTWMLAAVYLACRPRWVDRTVGLPHMYMIHGVLAILAIILAFLHQSLLPGAGALIGLTGHAGLYLFMAVAVWSLVFMASWLTAKFPLLAHIKRGLERVFRHEMSVWLHRLNLVAIALIALHVHVIDYIASIKPFIFLFDAATIAVFAYYVWSSVNRRAFALRGWVASVRPLADRVTELRVTFGSGDREQIRWNPGDFAFIAFPGKRGMHEFHPFSLTNAYPSPNSTSFAAARTPGPMAANTSTANGTVLTTPHPDAPVMSFAIRADGDFTARIASLKPGDVVRVVPPYGRYAEFIKEHDRTHDNTHGTVPLVLIGGGIGITPLLGVLTTYADGARPVDFLYTARSERDFIYRDELEQFGRTTPSTRIRLMAQRPDEAIIAPMIRPHAIYLIAGPQPMMEAVRAILFSHGVAADDIYYEPFAM